MVLLTFGRAGLTLCLADDHVAVAPDGQHCDSHGADPSDPAAPSAKAPHGDCTDLALAPLTLDRAGPRTTVAPAAAVLTAGPAADAPKSPVRVLFPAGPTRAPPPPHLALLATFLLLI